MSDNLHAAYERASQNEMEARKRYDAATNELWAAEHAWDETRRLSQKAFVALVADGECRRALPSPVGDPAA